MNPPITPARPVAPPTRRPGVRFLVSHPAHTIALGFGSGLSPRAPGTVGTLWAWMVFALLQSRLSAFDWGLVIGIGTIVGIWACTVAAQHLGVADPGCIVWDEVLAFWTILWLVTPAGWQTQCVAFVLFRIFDGAKPGPVAWADQRFKLRRGQSIGWRQGFGIVFDDFVAALCTLMVMALWRFL